MVRSDQCRWSADFRCTEEQFQFIADSRRRRWTINGFSEQFDSMTFGRVASAFVSSAIVWHWNYEILKNRFALKTNRQFEYSPNSFCKRLTASQPTNSIATTTPARIGSPGLPRSMISLQISESISTIAQLFMIKSWSLRVFKTSPNCRIAWDLMMQNVLKWKSSR